MGLKKEEQAALKSCLRAEVKRAVGLRRGSSCYELEFQVKRTVLLLWRSCSSDEREEVMSGVVPSRMTPAVISAAWEGNAPVLAEEAAP
eukprot:9845777-Karenia_brevis.AAC.1